jgi:hypothetical protein
MAPSGIAHYYMLRMIRENIFGFNRFDNRQGLELADVASVQFAPDINPTERIRFVNDILGYTEVKNRLSVYYDFQVDTDGLYDSDYHGTHEWHGMAGDMRAAYFQYTAPRWSLLAGRDFIHWGPGQTGSLLTSGFAPSLDMIKFTMDIWQLRFQSFDALLARTTDTEHDSLINRYYSGHRLSLRLPKTELALSETVIYGGPRQSVNTGFLNPLLPYYFTDVMFNEEKVKSNVTLSMELSLFWPAQWRFYGQFLVDEYYYAKEPYPNQTAFLFGFNYAGLNFAWVNMEYVNISRWVYNYRAMAPWNRLNYYNSLFGHPIGPDADLWHSEQEIYFGKNIIMRLFQDFLRKGETTITTPLILENERNDTHPSFPFGIAEKKLSFMIEFEYSPSVNLFLKGGMKSISVKNSGHIMGDNRQDFNFFVALVYRWRSFISAPL